MTNNMPSGTKKFHKSIKPENGQTFSFFFVFFLFFFFWRTRALLAMPFSNAHESLSSETIIIHDHWIRIMVVCMNTGRVFGIHLWLSVLREPGQTFFSQYCIHLLRKPMRTDMPLCDDLGVCSVLAIHLSELLLFSHSRMAGRHWCGPVIRAVKE